MRNSDKIILDLCGGTGSWSKPYKDAGYDVRLVTLPEHDVMTYKPPRDVYGILAAPPCTMFSIARTRAKKARDFRQGMEAVEACLDIIWECQKVKLLEFWALENPTGHLRKFLGHPPMWFYQWEFGTFFYKRTDIWGYFNEPTRLLKRRPQKTLFDQTNKKMWGHPEIPESLKHLKVTEARAAIRAITPPAFALAFKKANP